MPPKYELSSVRESWERWRADAVVSILGENLQLVHAQCGSPVELMAEIMSGHIFIAHDCEQQLTLFFFYFAVLNEGTNRSDSRFPFEKNIWSLLHSSSLKAHLWSICGPALAADLKLVLTVVVFVIGRCLLIKANTLVPLLLDNWSRKCTIVLHSGPHPRADGCVSWSFSLLPESRLDFVWVHLSINIGGWRVLFENQDTCDVYPCTHLCI